MRKSRSLPMFILVITIIICGNIVNGYASITFTKCLDGIKQFCFYEFTIYNDLHMKSSDNSKSYFYLDYTDTDYKSPTLLALLKNDEMLKIKSQAAHIHLLLERKRSQYQLYKVNIFGQLTSPINNEINYHKAQPPRMEGFGIRLRF